MMSSSFETIKMSKPLLPLYLMMLISLQLSVSDEFVDGCEGAVMTSSVR